MIARFCIAWAALFVLWMAGSFVVHGLLLGRDYAALPGLFRSPEEAQRHFHLLLLAHVVLSGAFCWIYLRGREARPWAGQGARFGLAIAVLTALPTYMIYYVVQPMPGWLATRQVLYDGVLIVVLGMAAAWLLRKDQ